MFNRWYKIVGITSELLVSWADDLRKDIIIWEENGVVEARIKLNILEAVRMRQKIGKFNKQQNSYEFDLVPV